MRSTPDTEEFESGQAGHLDIGDDDVGVEVGSGSTRKQRIGEGSNLTPHTTSRDLARQMRKIGIVIHDKDAVRVG